ncbi:MAG: alpha/beta hydrolase domain-containing protein [Blastocatellia bacterium]
MIRVLRLLSVVVLLLISPIAATAHVTQIEITSRTDVLNGRAFGMAGPYEKLIGRVYFAVDPNNPHNKIITDLDKAPRNGQKFVEFSADLYVLRPKNTDRGNGAALFEISNRGGKGMVRFFNHAAGSPDPTTTGEFGDGFLLRNGFTLVWVGWQFDTPEEKNTLRLYAPVATEDKKTITGLVRADFVFAGKTASASLGHKKQKAQPAIEPDNPNYKLSVRDCILCERRPIPREQWQFARWENDKAVPDNTSLYVQGGFEPGKIYEVVYRAENPVIVGLGLAAVRDLASYFKQERNDVATVRRVLAFGISQSGRFLRHFLYQGFNADEKGRQVFDGVNAHVAGAGHGSFNHRFAEPSRDASPFDTFFYPTDIFPFADIAQTDPDTKETEGILTVTMEQKVAPKIFYTNSSVEYWNRAASLTHTMVDGSADAPIPDNVRIYFFSGGQHSIAAFPPAKNLSQHAMSPLDYSWGMRALLLALDRWAAGATEPPASQYPRLASETLVRAADVRFPQMPDARLPKTLHEAWRVDYGPQFKSKGIITEEPPRIGREYPVMVPQVDADGLDLGGIRLPEAAVPLATYAGWNPRDAATGAPEQLVSLTGSYLPFVRTKADRERSGDARLSIEERYPSREHYLGMVTEATLQLIKDGYLLAGDMAPVIRRAAAHWDHANGPARASNAKR